MSTPQGTDQSTPTDIDSFADRLEALRVAAAAALDAAADLDALVEAQRANLGKRSPLAALGSALGRLDPAQRPAAGELLKQARQSLEAICDRRRQEMQSQASQARLAMERLDLTEYLCSPPPPPLGGICLGPGRLHLVTQTQQALEDTFVSMGFEVAEGPEAETDWYNFEALNMPAEHPARGMFDTIYLRLGQPETVLLRTHTSPVQIRLMESGRLPIYAVMPGRCYRRDTPDARHLPVFHQIEGLVVDKGISFAHLAGVIEAFTRAYFGPGMHSRLRPSYFPFTEPSAEFEVTCPICAGEGCRTCSGSGWIELGGCGMVDPNVFGAVGIDPETYSGFAFGFGIDRLAQVRVGLSDMRLLLDNDLRFAEQF